MDMQTIERTNKNYWMQIRHPYSCGIEITPYCNLHCVHCYLQDYRVEKLLSHQELFRILDILEEQGLLFVYFTGGEILTYPGFLDVYQYAKKKGFMVELLSNITLLDKAAVDVFRSLPPAKISISIYGASEETYKKMTGSSGNFARAINGLEMLKSAGIYFEIKFIGVKDNIRDFFAVKDIARRFNVKFSHSFELFPTLEQSQTPIDHMLTPENIVAFEREYSTTRRRWAIQSVESAPIESPPMFFCDIARSNFIIDCEGFMNPCNKLRTREYKILETPFENIWSAFAKYKQMKAPETYKCASCEKRTLCVPCPAENFLATGSYTTPNPTMCKLSAARMSEFSNSQYDCYRK